MELVDKRDDGDSAVAEISLTIEKTGSPIRRRMIRLLRKDDGPDVRSLWFVREPAELARTAFLIVDYGDLKRDDDQWFYLPALGKTKRLAGTDRNGAFLGSDFNMADLVKLPLDDFSYRLLEDTAHQGKPVWRVQVTPLTLEIAAKNGYSGYILWVRQDLNLVVHAESSLHGSVRTRVMDVRTLEQIDSIWTPSVIEMVTSDGATVVSTTVLDQSRTRYGQNLDVGIFTSRQLEKGP
jgi:hypothetical protein